MSESQPESNAPAPDERITEAEAVDVEALLDQAEQLAVQAADEVGHGDSPSATPTIDLADPLPGTQAVDIQLDEISALVAEANAAAATWAATDDKSPVVPARRDDRDDSAAAEPQDHAAIPHEPAPQPAEPLAQAGSSSPSDAGHQTSAMSESDAASASAAPAELSTAPPARPESQTDRADQEPSSPSAVDSLGADAADSPVAPSGPRMPRLAASTLSAVTWPVNRPFQNIGDGPRRWAGLIGIATLLTAILVWLLPLLKK